MNDFSLAIMLALFFGAGAGWKIYRVIIVILMRLNKGAPIFGLREGVLSGLILLALGIGLGAVAEIASRTAFNRLVNIFGAAILIVMVLVPTAAPADNVVTEYTYKVSELVPTLGNPPILLLAATGLVTNSSVGNQSYYASVCFIAENTTSKTVKIARYQFTFLSPFREQLGTRYTTVRQVFAPFADTVESREECWKMVNPWGSNVDRVIVRPVEVLFSDGTIWKTEGPTHEIGLESLEQFYATPKPAPTPRPTPTPEPTPEPSPPPMPPWSGPAWSAPEYLKPTPTPSP